MTATEALKFIDEIEWCSLCRINKHCSDEMEQKCEDMRKTVVEALEKQAIIDKESDKYRWHDLRKDPEDLPKIKNGCREVSEDVEMIILSNAGLKHFASGRYHYDFPNEFAVDDMYRGTVYVKINQISAPQGTKKGAVACAVIAWREIEPFTDEYIFPENADHRKQRGRTAPNRGEK